MFPRRDPVRRLLGDEELTVRLSQVLTQVARERNEPSFIAMLSQMNSLELKALRAELDDRVEQYEQELAEAKRESWRQLDDRHQPPPPLAWRPTGELVIKPGGAIVDAGFNEIDSLSEQARERSRAARAETERIEREHAAAERAEYEQAAAADDHELPAHLRRRP